MKCFTCLICCGITLFYLTGCQRPDIRNNGSQKTIEKHGNFPEIMVGAWVAKIDDKAKTQWGINFEKDGIISQIIHRMAGPVDMSKGSVYKEGPEEDTYIVVIMGPSSAEYDEDSGILNVAINTERYRMKLLAGIVEGYIDDYFSGAISTDGKTWEADWINLNQLERTITNEGEEFPANPIDREIIRNNPRKLMFKKAIIPD